MSGRTLRYSVPAWKHDVEGRWEALTTVITSEDWEVLKFLRSHRKGSTSYDEHWVAARGLRPYCLHAYDDYYPDYTSGAVIIPWELLEAVFEEGFVPGKPMKGGLWLTYTRDTEVVAVCTSIEFSREVWGKPAPADIENEIVYGLRSFRDMVLGSEDCHDVVVAWYERYLRYVLLAFPPRDALGVLAGALVEDDEDRVVVDVIRMFKEDVED